MEKNVFYIAIDCRGYYWKGMAIYNAIEVNLQQKIVLMNEKLFLNIAVGLKQSKCHHNSIIKVFKFILFTF